MLVCEVNIVVHYKDQKQIDLLLREQNPFPYAEKSKRCRGYLDPVRAWLEDQKKDPAYLRFNVEYVHVSEKDDYKSVVIKTI